MEAKRLPDTETLVLEALRHYMPETSWFIRPQKDWDDEMAFGVVSRVGGASDDPRLIDMAILSVGIYAPARKQASDLARDAQRSIAQAVMDQFSVPDEGVLTHLRVTKGPVEDRDGLTGKHADAELFDATYTLWSRANY